MSPPPPRNLTRGFKRSLCCEEEDDQQGEDGTGESMVKGAGGSGCREIASKENIYVIAGDQGSC
jgi:hypothetical protein